MKKLLPSLIAILLIAVGCFSFAQEKNWIEYGEDDYGWTITIYSPDGYGIVIQDRNIWAATTWWWRNAPADSYWNYYQWWNNYGFPSDSSSTISTSTTKVDASLYSPENPYSNDTFIITNWWDWNSILNDNLRWWEWDDDTNWWGLTSNNPITDRQWPCPEWYHIPSIWEWNELKVIWYNNEYGTDLSIDDFGHLASYDTPINEAIAGDLLIPFAWLRDAWWDLVHGQITMLWSSTPDDVYADYLELLHDSRYHIFADYDYRATAVSVRCFKNERVYPEASKTLILNISLGESVVSTWVSFTDDNPITSEQILKAINWLSNEIDISLGYHFERYTDDEWVETKFDLDTAISEGTITSNLTLKWKIEPNKYTINFLHENGAEIMSVDFTYDQETTIPANTSTKEWYTFKWWKDSEWNAYEDGATIKNLTTENGAVLEFSPIREPNKYIIKFLDEDGNEIMSKEFTYDQESILPANTSTKEWYTFSWWMDSQWNNYEDWATVKNLTTENWAVLEFTTIRKKQESKTPGYSWWGGWRWSNKNETEIGIWTDKDDEKENNKRNNTHISIEDWNRSEVLNNWYSIEENNAYRFAFKYRITTMDSIEKADMYWPLTRIAMAKMLSNYAINILKQTPDISRGVPEFPDVDDILDTDYDNWVTLAYQLGIMWIGINEFRPFDLVPRAEFWTALSRMLFRLADGDNLYYETHFQKLKEEWVMSILDPYMQELRGYVMIMLMRSSK